MGKIFSTFNHHTQRCNVRKGRSIFPAKQAEKTIRRQLSWIHKLSSKAKKGGGRGLNRVSNFTLFYLIQIWNKIVGFPSKEI